MTGLHDLHLFALGLWGGVVLVEMLLELGARNDRVELARVALWHARIDRYFELPLLAIIVGSGTLLWQRSGWDMTLAWKVAAGLGAIAANLVCAWYVVKRVQPQADLQRLSTGVLLTAAPGFPFGIAALIMGGMRAGWW